MDRLNIDVDVDADVDAASQTRYTHLRLSRSEVLAPVEAGCPSLAKSQMIIHFNGMA